MDEIDLANERAEQTRDDALRSARAKMDSVPSNGVCRACQMAIEAERLVANPTARLCRECAADEEADRRRRLKTGV